MCCCPTQVVFILNTIGAEGQMHYKILTGEEKPIITFNKKNKAAIYYSIVAYYTSQELS